jgi:hypothetical protein
VRRRATSPGASVIVVPQLRALARNELKESAGHGSLAHVSDEQAARALSRQFGAIKKAAEDLGVDPKHLRRLVWSNPGILDAAHERMSLFAFFRRDEVMSGLVSNAASVRRRAVDRMFANPGLFGDLQHPLLPAARPRRGPSAEARAQLARERLDREAAAELERERAIEREREAAAEREIEDERRRKREATATVVAISRPPAVSLWPAGIRRPTRGRRWR